jgi:hypothetical protein
VFKRTANSADLRESHERRPALAADAFEHYEESRAATMARLLRAGHVHPQRRPSLTGVLARATQWMLGR